MSRRRSTPAHPRRHARRALPALAAALALAFPATAHAAATTPNVPTAVDTVPSKGCGTATAPAWYTTAQPTYAAHMSDPDPTKSLTTQIQIFDTADPTDPVYDAASAPQVGGPTGVTTQFPPLPTGILTDNHTYTFHARTTNDTTSSPWTTPCWFRTDLTPPDHQPTITPGDWGEFGPPVGTPGTIGFGANGVPDVVSFRYGFDKTALNLSVPASPDGTATVPLTLWDDRPHTLYVQSVDRAGNLNTGEPASIDIQASPGTATPPHHRGDTNGDGLADINAVQDAGNGRTQDWTITAKPGGGFYTPVTTFDTRTYPADRTRTVKGDFNGDGLSDLAVFRDEGNLRVTLSLLLSNGNALTAPATPAWDSGAGNGWGLANMKLVAGDFDRNGHTDIAAYYDYGNAHTRVWLWLAKPDGTGFLPPTIGWDSRPGQTAWSQLTPLVGDFNGDGHDDLMQVYRYPNGSFTFWEQTSTGIGFSAPAPWYTNPAGWSDLSKTKLVAGDFNHDGRADVADLYDYGNTRSGLWLYPSTATALRPATQVWNSGPGNWSWNASTPVAGDTNGDGATDLTLAYTYPDTHLALWTLTNTGTGLPATFPESWSSPGPFPLGGTNTTFL